MPLIKVFFFTCGANSYGGKKENESTENGFPLTFLTPLSIAIGLLHRRQNANAASPACRRQLSPSFLHTPCHGGED